MTPQARRIALIQSLVWTFIVLLGMASAFNFALVVTGATNWLTPGSALFTVLGTLALAATQFSIMLGGNIRKTGSNATREH